MFNLCPHYANSTLSINFTQFTFSTFLNYIRQDVSYVGIWLETGIILLGASYSSIEYNLDDGISDSELILK